MTMFSNLLGMLRPANRAPKLEITSVPTLEAYEAHLARMAGEHRKRWELELSLSAPQTDFQTPGYCYVCRRNVRFDVDFKYAHDRINGKLVPNWRERVDCPCKLNNRMRASVQILEEFLGAKPHSSVYIAEQITPLYRALKSRFPRLVGSEYLGDSVPFGETDARGLRNESIARLTFEDESFDYILNFDVLEHIPDPTPGLREMCRVLKPGGSLLMSVPFLMGQEQSRLRASVNADGTVKHLLEPHYHGDPVSDKGCLCFVDFGWELLSQMRAAGFTKVEMLLYWSAELGYFGVEQPMIYARR